MVAGAVAANGLSLVGCGNDVVVGVNRNGLIVLELELERVRAYGDGDGEVSGEPASEERAERDREERSDGWLRLRWCLDEWWWDGVAEEEEDVVVEVEDGGEEAEAFQKMGEKNDTVSASVGCSAPSAAVDERAGDKPE